MGIALSYSLICIRYLFSSNHYALFTRLIAPDVTPQQVEAVLKSPPRSPLVDVLGTSLSILLAYTDAMTLDVQVPDAVFAELKKSFSEREVVEITATISAYNCVSRFLVALDVGERNAQTGPKEGGKE